MVIDYSPVGGVGIELTDDIKEILFNKCPDDIKDDECVESMLDHIGISYNNSGCNLSGTDIVYYLLVQGNTLNEINRNSESFIKKLSEVGVNISSSDLIIIEELRIW